MVIYIDSRNRMPGFGSQLYYFLAVRFVVSYLTA